MPDIYRDFVYTRNTVAVDATMTTLTVEDVSLFPPSNLVAKQDFFITFESALAYPHAFEIMKLVRVDVALKQLTVIRGQGGTTAVPHPIATYIKGTLTGDMLRRLRSGLVGTQLPSNDAEGLVVGDRFYHQTERRFYAWTGVTGQLRDTFTRSNSTTTLGSTEIGSISTGSGSATATPWTNVFGTFGISNNQAYVTAVDLARSEAIVITNAGGHDVDVTVDVTLPEAGNTAEGSLVVRMDANAMNGYLAQLRKDGVWLYRKSNGTYTQIGTFAHTLADGGTWPLRVIASGNNIRVLVDANERINFNESVSGFTVGSNFSSIGSNVGFRTADSGSGTARALTSTALRWDNFRVDHPSGAVGGWQPLGVSQADTERTNYSVGTALATIARQFDEVLPLIQDDERTTLVARRDNALLVNKVSDIREAVVEVERQVAGQARADTLLAVTLEEVVEILKGNLSSGVGPPSIANAAPGWFHLDRASKRLYMFSDAGTWTPLTFTSTPGTLAAAFHTASHVSPQYTNTFSIPAGARVGDVCFAMLATVHSGTMYDPPAGWTLINRSLTTPYNHNNVCLVYKYLTAADLNATHRFLTGGDTTCVVHVRAYSGTFNPSGGSAYTFGNGQPNYTSPAINNPVANSRLITWMASGILYASSKINDPVQQNPLNTSGYGSYIGQHSQDELVATVGAAPQRGFTQTGYYTTTGWATAAILVNPGASDSPSPIYAGVGAPQSNELLNPNNLVDGALYLDKTSKTVHLWRDGAWRGFLLNVISTTQTPVAARDRDYVLLRPSLGIGSHHASNLTGGGQQITLATTAETVIFAWRGTWGNYGASATLNGAAMTLRGNVQGGGGSWAAMFGGDLRSPAGSNALVLSGGTGAGVDARAAIAVANANPTGITYMTSGSTSLTLTGLVAGGMVVMYAHGNGGTPPSISNAGGLTWTRHQAISSGSTNAMSTFSAPIPAGFASSTTVTITPGTSYDIMLAAAVPPAGGMAGVVTLPAPTAHAQIFVQNDDPNGAEVRVEPTSGTINGQANHVLTARYAAGIYTSDGVNWFLASTGGGGGGTVTRRTAAYTARSGDLVLADAATAAFTVTLPTPVANATVTVKKVDQTGNAITITPTSGTVDGTAGSLTITMPYESLDFVADGTNWWLI